MDLVILKELGLFVLGYMVLWYLLALWRRDNSVVDVAWGLGFVALAWFSLWRYGDWGGRELLLVGLVSLWGVRLSGHILRRNWGKGEDFRYAKWRKEWGGEDGVSLYFLVRSFLQVFVLQGVLMLVIASGFLTVNVFVSDLYLGAFAGVGALIWLIGFYFEVVGDWQLDRFIEKKKKGEIGKGAIMKEGLWRYTRHPNYFGEVTMWWGIWVIVSPLVVFDIKILATLISPLMITLLILFVSGVPMLEKKYEGNEEFEKYKKRTNKFFPWFPK